MLSDRNIPTLDNAFVAAQKINIKLNANKAHKIVVSAAVSAAGIGAAPIPFSDVAGIVPVQIGMLARISVIFGLSVDKLALSTLVGSLFGAGGGAFGGRVLVGNLLKLFPGAGSLAGAAISGTTAGALTTMIGESYIAVIVRLIKRNNGQIPTTEEVSTAFRREHSLLGSR